MSNCKLLILGLAGSGKTEFLRIIERRPDWGGADWSEIMRTKWPASSDFETTYAAAEELTRSRGPSWVAQEVFESLPAARNIAIAGARSWQEVMELERRMGKLTGIWIDAPTALRHARILGRKRADAAVRVEDLVRRDMRELEGGLASLAMARLNFVLQNAGTLADYSISIKALLDNLEMVGQE